MTKQDVLHILIVDNDLGIRDALRLFFTSEHIDVHACKEKESMERIQKYHPNVLLLDIPYYIKEKEIKSLIQSIHQQYADTVRIILFSADPFIEEHISEYHADGFLPKPFDIDLLQREIAQIPQSPIRM